MRVLSRPGELNENDNKGHETSVDWGDIICNDGRGNKECSGRGENDGREGGREDQRLADGRIEGDPNGRTDGRKSVWREFWRVEQRFWLDVDQIDSVIGDERDAFKTADWLQRRPRTWVGYLVSIYSRGGGQRVKPINHLWSTIKQCLIHGSWVG